MFEKISRRNKIAIVLFFFSGIMFGFVLLAYNIGPLDPLNNVVMDAILCGFIVIPFISACLLYDPGD